MGLILFIPAVAQSSDECLGWFKKTGINPKDSGCEVDCAAVETDMATFMCTNRCDEFCRPAPKCKHDPFWMQKIKDGRAVGWPVPLEKSVAWSKDEREALLTVLDQLPDDLKVKGLRGIYRLQKSVDIINPGSQNEGAISLYDRAFGGPFSLGRVIAHELAHQWYAEAPKAIRQGYESELGWRLSSKGNESPKHIPDRKFVSPDADDSPQEDFAHNVDTYLFQPDKLRSISPKAFDWIRKHFSKEFKLREGCKDAARK